jgi:hypothetical protein
LSKTEISERDVKRNIYELMINNRLIPQRTTNKLHSKSQTNFTADRGKTSTAKRADKFHSIIANHTQIFPQQTTNKLLSKTHTSATANHGKTPQQSTEKFHGKLQTKPQKHSSAKQTNATAHHRHNNGPIAQRPADKLHSKPPTKQQTHCSATRR